MAQTICKSGAGVACRVGRPTAVVRSFDCPFGSFRTRRDDTKRKRAESAHKATRA